MKLFKKSLLLGAVSTIIFLTLLSILTGLYKYPHALGFVGIMFWIYATYNAHGLLLEQKYIQLDRKLDRLFNR